jgi:hypothetical protein
MGEGKRDQSPRTRAAAAPSGWPAPRFGSGPCRRPLPPPSTTSTTTTTLRAPGSARAIDRGQHDDDGVLLPPAAAAAGRGGRPHDGRLGRARRRRGPAAADGPGLGRAYTSCVCPAAALYCRPRPATAAAVGAHPRIALGRRPPRPRWLVCGTHDRHVPARAVAYASERVGA